MDTPRRIARDVQRRLDAGETLDSILAADAEAARALGIELNVPEIKRTLQQWLAKYVRD